MWPYINVYNICHTLSISLSLVFLSGEGGFERMDIMTHQANYIHKHDEEGHYFAT